MEFTVTIKNDSDRDPDMARMYLTIDGEQGVGGIRISSAACADILGRIAYHAATREPAWLVAEIQRQEHLIKRLLKKGRK